MFVGDSVKFDQLDFCPALSKDIETDILQEKHFLSSGDPKTDVSTKFSNSIFELLPYFLHTMLYVRK